MPRKIIKSRFFVEDEFVETVSEVSTEKHEDWEPNENLKYVGKQISRKDGYDKVSGTAVYTSDKILPNMTHAKILRCPLPHARIKKINTKKAEKLQGVLDIITHENIKQIPWYYETTLLFDPHLRYQGDEVACVAAESEYVANQALKLIEVEYEELPFELDSEKAMKPEATQIHEWGNIIRGRPFTDSRGDIEKGFAEADAVVEDEFTSEVVIHNPMEFHCSVVNWDGNKLTIWDSTQNVFGVRDEVSASLGIPESDIRVIKKYMGGGFGSKLHCGKYTVMAALLAKNIGRPVKIAMDRKEMNLAVGNRPDSFQRLKVGAKSDGTLVAMDHYAYGTVGAYPYGAGCSWPFRTLYKCENINVEEYSVVTNAGRACAMRAPGHVKGIFGFEQIIDEAAEKIGMDPLEFRIKNYTEVDPVSDLPYTSKKLREAYEKGADAIGWDRRKEPAGSDKGNLKRGIGMASQIWWGGGGPPSFATLKLNGDESIHILSGTQDIGTGTYTALAVVAAEVLDIPIEKITVTLGDTDACPVATVSGGSLTIPSVTPAVRDAAEKIKNKLISGAAAVLEVPEEKIIYAERVMKVKDDESKKLSIRELLQKMGERQLVATGARNANPEGYEIKTFGAQFAEVEVDTETGKIRVIKVVTAHDVGRVINWKTYENQIHGGVIQGIGFALLEERVMDESTGKLLTTNIHDYKLPTIRDIPEILAISVNEGDPLMSNTGAKGCGEPAHIPTAGAIANAVYNAIGVRIKSAPMTPDKVLMALQNKN
jgi:xanthine dehydrogenase YagR molybdenum-binding subunit